jgi:hypothetical protein
VLEVCKIENNIKPEVIKIPLLWRGGENFKEIFDGVVK